MVIWFTMAFLASRGYPVARNASIGLVAAIFLNCSTVSLLENSTLTRLALAVSYSTRACTFVVQKKAVFVAQPFFSRNVVQTIAWN